MSKLALFGGIPVRTKPFPEWPRLTSELGESVLKTLQNENWGVGSDAISRFEDAFALFHDAKYCISTSSGTTALWVHYLNHPVFVHPSLLSLARRALQTT